jgi:DMSO/TMAO reductase YedYZ molybdopterin-dependent catalytic subunit
MLTRRQVVRAAGAGLALSGSGVPLIPREAAAAEGRINFPAELPQGVRDNATLEALPGKKPLIRLTYRPPNYETPLEYFRTAITPNDAFFVRYHLSVIPEIDAGAWRLGVGGEGADHGTELTLDDLKRMPPAEVVAVNQCSGNRRGLFQPHVPGVEWGYGAMGCARWKGARLKDVLDKVGLKKEAIEIAFDGADSGITDKTPDFVKSIPVWKAVEDTTLIAYEMNEVPLPHWNGFPARLVVPGWTGTYWMKHLTSISARTRPEGSFWMHAAYRVPLGKFPVVARFTSQETAANTPITEMVVNSVITAPEQGAQIKAGATVQVSGIAWDGGYGISTVEISIDDGKTWSAATLGEDLGRYAFRTFSFKFPAKGKGKHTVAARAFNKIGQSQTTELIPNPAGYHHNVIHSVSFDVA